MAQSTIIRARNNTGVTLAAGTIVYISGFDNTDQTPIIAPADNRYEHKMPAVGAIREDILNGEVDIVKINGPVMFFDTSGRTVNDNVFVGQNGQITFIEPAAFNYNLSTQQIGTVRKVADYPDGELQLFPLEVKDRIRHPDLIEVYEDQHHIELHSLQHRPFGLDAFVHASQHAVGGGDTIDHGLLNNLTEDTHQIYSLVDGTRAFTGVVSGITPTASSHLATKNYVDLNVVNRSWRDPVIDKGLTSPPVFPNTGDRYIVASVASGLWLGHEDDLTEWNGISWDFFTPTEGFAVWVSDEDSIYIWTGLIWAFISSTATVLTGSGTSGYVTFWTDTSILSGDSNLYWDNTNKKLGLGTASPQNRIDINGALAIGTTYAGLNTAPANGLIIEGNVGIGQTSATEKLELSGAIKIGTATGTANGTIRWTGADFEGRKNNIWTSFTDYASSGISGAIQFSDGADGFLSDETNLFWNNADNRLGINESDPARSVELRCEVVIGATGISNAIAFAPASGGAIIWTNSSYDVSDPNTGWANTLTLNAGNVGIGPVNSPVNKLDVEGAVAIGAAYSGTSTAPTNGLLVEGQVGIGTNNPDTTVEINAAAATELTIHSTTSGGTSAIEVGTGGTGNRASQIDLVGDSTYTDYGLRIIRDNSGANTNSFIKHRGTGNFGIVAQDAAALAFFTTDTERVRIKPTGEVGIGAASPATALEINAAGATVLTIHSTTSGENCAIELGKGGAGNRVTYMNFNSDDSGNAGFSLSRGAIGVNSDSFLAHRGTGGLVLESTDAGYISFETTNAERARIIAGGDVGIGRTDPQAKVHIDSTVTGNADLFILESDANTDGNYVGIQFKSLFSTTESPMAAIRATIDSGNDRGLGFYTTTDRSTLVEQMHIDHLGRVGIGTNSPDALLDVEGGTAKIRIRDSANHVSSYTELYDVSDSQFTIQKTANTGGAVIDFSPIITDGTNYASIRCFRNTNTTASPALQVLAGDGNLTVHAQLAGKTGHSFVGMGGGKFGVGTNSPLVDLHVQGTNPQFLLKEDDNHFFGIDVDIPSDTQTALFTDINRDLVFGAKTDATDAALTEQWLVFKSDGKVGIGETAPTEKLEIYPDTDVSLIVGRAKVGYAQTGAADWASFGHIDANTITGYALSHNSAGKTIINSETGQDIDFRTGSVVKMVLDGASGNVVIANDLQVSGKNIFSGNTANHIAVAGGTSATPGAKVGIHGSTSTSPSYIYHDAYRHIFRDVDASPTAMVIEGDTGKVGVGEPVPDTTLHIKGADSNDHGQLKVESTGNDARISLYNVDGAAATGRGDIMMSKHATYTGMRFLINNSDKMIIDEAGNVGIGASSPGYNLEVNGATQAQIAVVGTNSGALSALKIGSGGTGDRYAYIDMVGDDTYDGFGLRIIRGNTGENTTSQLVHRGTGDFQIITNEAANIEFSTTNSTRWIINGSGDFICIGTHKIVADDSSSDHTAPAYSFSGDSNTGIFQAAGDTIGFSTGGTEKMRIDSNGQVGIGEASPDGNLHIVEGTASGQTAHTSMNTLVLDSTSTAMGISILGPTNGAQYVGFGDTDDNYRGGIRYSHADDEMQFFVNNTTPLYMKSDGKVGINNSAPDTMLHVQIATAGAIAPIAGSTLTLESNGNGYLQFLTPASADTGILFGDTGNAAIGQIRYSHPLNKMRFYTNGSSQMSIDTNGEVYIPGATNAGTSTTSDLYINTSDGQLGLNSSSITVKQNVTNMEDTSWLYDLRPVNFEYIDNPGAKWYGLIAEEIESIIPEFVHYDVYRDQVDAYHVPEPNETITITEEIGEDGYLYTAYNRVIDGYEPAGINYSRFISVLINEAQKIHNTVFCDGYVDGYDLVLGDVVTLADDEKYIITSSSNQNCAFVASSDGYLDEEVQTYNIGKGYVYIEPSTSVSVGDKLVSSNAPGTAKVDNTETDFSNIIGYAWKTTTIGPERELIPFKIK